MSKQCEIVRADGQQCTAMVPDGDAACPECCQALEAEMNRLVAARTIAATPMLAELWRANSQRSREELVVILGHAQRALCIAARERGKTSAKTGGALMLRWIAEAGAKLRREAMVTPEVSR